MNFSALKIKLPKKKELKRHQAKRSGGAKPGFTLPEMMIAIFVITVGLVGIYAIVPRVVLGGIWDTNRFIAAELAKEGIELVRNIRDTNWLAGLDWDSGLAGCSGGCEIDYNDAAPVAFQDRFLKISSNGFYNYETGQETKFKRMITIIREGEDLLVQAEVSWPGKYSPLVVKSRLYNWR